MTLTVLLFLSALLHATYTPLSEEDITEEGVVKHLTSVCLTKEQQSSARTQDLIRKQIFYGEIQLNFFNKSQKPCQAKIFMGSLLLEHPTIEGSLRPTAILCKILTRSLSNPDYITKHAQDCQRLLAFIKYCVAKGSVLVRAWSDTPKALVEKVDFIKPASPLTFATTTNPQPLSPNTITLGLLIEGQLAARGTLLHASLQ